MQNTLLETDNFPEIYRILVINTGSTSTKIAVFDGETEVTCCTINHSVDELMKYETMMDQFELRKKMILDVLHSKQIDLSTINAVVGRGGFLKPMEGGTYKVNNKMLTDLRWGLRGEHASNLGGILADNIAQELNVLAYTVDPVVVDEMEEIARISGMPEIKRRSIFHALNQRAVARRAAKELGKKYEEMNLIVVHLGGGISIGVHREGRVIDVSNAFDGEGPFSPERSGGVPVGKLIELCFSGKLTMEEMHKKIVGKGGLMAYLGTYDGREVRRRIAEGDTYAELIYKAMAYQIAKEIAAYAPVLYGKIDVICITGGLAHDELLVGWIKEKIAFLGEVKVYPGEDEVRSLAEGVLRVLRGEEDVKEYC